MKSQSKHFWALVAVLLAAGVVINFLEVVGEARVPRRALVEFPTQVGEWQQVGPDARFDAATEEVLRADDYVTRDYTLTAAGGGIASLYIGYYSTQRAGATYHSPLNCLPGSGWTLTDPATVEIKPAGGGPSFEANRYILQNGTTRQLLVYWYQGRGRAVASEYWDKVYTVMDSVRRRRSDGSMVRVLIPVVSSDEEALQKAVAFSSQVAPNLPAYIPD